MAHDPPAAGRWPRDRFAEAVWSSQLPGPARLVALAYADHARDQDTAWVGYERLVARTGLGRSTCARAVRLLLEQGWLEVVEPARQHRSARYRIIQQSQSGTSDPAQQSQNGTPDVASSPALVASSPALVASSPAPGPDRSSLPEDQHHSRTREELGAVIVIPEDRQPESPASLADRLRGRGVDWPDRDIEDVRRRLTDLLGGDTRAEGQAMGVLAALADIVPAHRIRSLGAWARALTDEQLLGHRTVVTVTGARRRTTPTSALDQAALDDARQRTAALDADPLGEHARADARRNLGPDATKMRLDKEASLLLRDPDWRSEQRGPRLGASA